MAVAVSQAQAAPSKLVVFGDSLSDNGNAAALGFQPGATGEVVVGEGDGVHLRPAACVDQTRERVATGIERIARATKILELARSYGITTSDFDDDELLSALFTYDGDVMLASDGDILELF